MKSCKKFVNVLVYENPNGIDQEGEPCDMVYLVVANDATGRQWQHIIERPAHSIAEKFCNKIRLSGAVIDISNGSWFEIGPIFGSESYLELVDEVRMVGSCY
jgi:hypothetical protein